MIYVELKYNANEFKNMTPEQQAVFEENWPGMRLILGGRRKTYQDKPEEIMNVSSWEYGTRQRLTLAEAHALQMAGIDVTLEALDGTMLQPQKDNGQRLDKYGDVHTLDLTSGSVVQITVPDLGLLQINEVDWLDDACTQAVQTHLDEGWRILAVCPPNASRRPSYIFGRQRRAD